jgi:hypothetical protein
MTHRRGREDVTKPNDFDVYRHRRERKERRRRIMVAVLDVLIALTLLAIGAIVLKMILY